MIPFSALYGDPDLISCWCGRDDCRHMRKLKAEMRRDLELAQALEQHPDDLEWLERQGWDGRFA